MLNAQDSDNFNLGDGGGFFVRPIRDDDSGAPLLYNSQTGEITYDGTVRRRLKKQEALQTRTAELERQLTSALEEQAELKAQVQALTATVQKLLA